MNITKTRQTRRRSETTISFDFTADVPQIKFGSQVTKAMIIERTAQNGSREVITFSQAYSELSMWINRSFANISEMGFSDALCEMFLSNSTIFTSKASYKLWNAVRGGN